MKVRTEARRDAILEVASAAFLELGFERASMAEIATRVGGSKATLYGYFPSKEALFLAVTHSAGEQHMHDALVHLESSSGTDLPAALRRFGEKLLTFMCSPTAVAAHRMVVGQASQSDIGRLFHDAGPGRGLKAIAAFMAAAMEAGQLKRSDPAVAAEHFAALVGAENQHRVFVRDLPPITRPQIRQAVERAVAAFLAGHGI